MSDSIKKRGHWRCACGEEKSTEDLAKLIEIEDEKYLVCENYPECGKEILSKEAFRDLRRKSSFQALKERKKLYPEKWQAYREKINAEREEEENKILERKKELGILREIRDEIKEEKLGDSK